MIVKIELKDVDTQRVLKFARFAKLTLKIAGHQNTSSVELTADAVTLRYTDESDRVDNITVQMVDLIFHEIPMHVDHVEIAMGS